MNIERSNIRKSNRCDAFTVGVNSDGKIEIFTNRDDEYVINEGYTVMYRGTKYHEAEKAAKRYLYRNSSYVVIEFIQDGLKKYKIKRHEGIITTAPLGTVGICRRLRDAKILVKILEAKKSKKDDSVSSAITKSA